MNKEVNYCSYCGTKIRPGSKFCKECGSPVQQIDMQEEKSIEKEICENKCPNCGGAINSFQNRCPYCGTEIRDNSSKNAVKELTSKLEMIDAQEMPIKTNSSLLYTIEKDNFNKQKQERKLNLIKTFSIPNTKEDIFEFVILASSNIDTDANINSYLTEAWISKLKQSYEKSKLLYDGTTEFKQIQKICESKLKIIEDTRKRNKTMLNILISILSIFTIAAWIWLFHQY
jgi:predicted nucleic acid-binding Zn ribbon protein